MAKKFNDASIATVTSLDDTHYINTVNPSTGELDKILISDVRTDLGGGPAIYAANISQSSTSAPTVSTPVNNIGATITFARTSAGLYTATASAPVFTANKTFVFFTPVQGGPRITMEVSSTTVIDIQTFDVTATLADGQLQGNSFKIEIYP